MRHFLSQLEKFFPLLRNSTLPAFLFGLSLLSFYGGSPFEAQSIINLHIAFCSLSLLCFLILVYFNRNKPSFFLLIIFSSYILINYLKNTLGESSLSSASYLNLCTFISLNIGLFYYLPEQKLLTRQSVYILLFLFFEYTIGEHLSRAGISIIPQAEFGSISGLESINLLLFAIVLISQFITSSLTGRILDSGLFFASLCIGFGLYYADSNTSLPLFFGTAIFITLLSGIEHLYQSTYKDELTELPGRNSFLLHSKDFPLKYSIGLILIDDYERLSKVFGRQGINSLVKMISQRLQDTETEAQIYRYNDDEFVVLFRGEDKKSAFNRVEQMRRSIASAEFMLRGYKKPIKLTVSGSVSEKKRSDANAVEVLVRADKALQKAYRFTQNITSQA